MAGTSAEAVLPALRAMAAQLNECAATGEFLLLGGAADSAMPDHVDSVPVRHIPLESAAYGDLLRAAQGASAGDWLVTLEAPSIDDASLIMGLWHRRHEGDLIIASRYIFGGSQSVPLLRRAGSRFLNWLYRKGLSVPVCDLSSSRRMYRTRLLNKVAITGDDYDVLMEVLLRFMAVGGRVLETPWHFESRRYRQQPGTLIRLARSSVATFFRLHALRNSVGFPDYDTRAYDSRIWLQRYWQRKRFRVVRAFSGSEGLTLDAGCGTSRIISTRPDMIAMDLNFSRLLYLSKTNPRRLQATAGCLPFPDKCFGTVVSSQVIEHTPERSCIAECVRVLRDGGTLVLGTPDYGRIWWPITEKIYGWVKRGGYAEEHITQYTLASLVEEVEDLGCKVLDYKYILGGELIIKAIKGG
jgi:SAM-dependent methyltransferase